MNTRPSNMRTPLGRVRGFGSAKSGTDDFIRQRLTAIANIPLTIAAIVIVMSLTGSNHAAVRIERCRINAARFALMFGN